MLDFDTSVLASAVAIDNGEGCTGSGSVIGHANRNTYVLTCAHVLGAGRPKVISQVGSKVYKLMTTVHKVDTKRDLALLRTTRRLPVPAIRIAKDEELPAPPDENFFLVASPGGVFNLVARCFLSQASKEWWVYTGQSSGGVSGGMLTYEGRLCGVVSRGNDDATVGFAIPPETVRRFLKGAF